MKKDKDVFWYDDGRKLTNVIIGLIVLIIILSQSFAIKNNLSMMDILSNVVNHNTIYLLMLMYFLALKTSMGKKYFNYINCLVVLIYFIMAITSLLSVFHVFSLNSILALALNFLLFIYVFHVFFKDTRVWDDFKLYKSPFNELSNDWYFSTIVVISVVLLAVNLILTTTLDGTFLAILDAFYIVMFARYVNLYETYLEDKKELVKIDDSEVSDSSLEKVEEDKDDEINKMIDEVKDENDVASSDTEKVEDVSDSDLEKTDEEEDEEIDKDESDTSSSGAEKVEDKTEDDDVGFSFYNLIDEAYNEHMDDLENKANEVLDTEIVIDETVMVSEEKVDEDKTAALDELVTDDVKEKVETPKKESTKKRGRPRKKKGDE